MISTDPAPPPPSDTINDLLNELERLSETQEPSAKEARKKVWERLSTSLGKSEPLVLVDDLVQDLGVQPITVKRWISGDFAPRAVHLRRIRSVFSSPAAHTETTFLPGEAPDQPVPLGSSFAALRTINHSFYALRYASTAFFFKGVLGFHTGRSQSIRQHLVEVMRLNAQLKLYYVFLEASTAEKTFEKVRRGMDLIDPACGKRVFGVRIPKNEDTLGLSFSLALPWVIVYNEDGRRMFRREVDIWYELPVERLTAANEVNDYDPPLYTLVQVPADDAEDVWPEWREWLKGLVGTDGKPEIDPQDLKQCE